MPARRPPARQRSSTSGKGGVNPRGGALPDHGNAQARALSKNPVVATRFARLSAHTATRRIGLTMTPMAHPKSARVFLIPGLLLMAAPLQAQVRYFSTNNGEWHTPSLWSGNVVPTTNDVYIGRTAPITLTISSADAISGSGRIGMYSYETATVEVLEGRKWIVNGGLYAGGEGKGTLNIRAGSSVAASSTYVGFYAASIGVTLVTGTNSLLSNSAEIRVGSQGQGTLKIEDGGKTTSATANVGLNAGSTGIVNVSGAASAWENSGDMLIGSSGSGTININGGTVTSNNTYLGFSPGSTGVVSVSGASSLLDVKSSLWMGVIGSGALAISGGGKVTAVTSSISGSATGSGSVNVTDTGSSLITGDLTVARNGTGSLTVANGGKVTAGVVSVATDGSSSGMIQLNGTSAGRGVLEMTSITEGNGSIGGRIDFDGGILRTRAASANLLGTFETGDVAIHDGGAFIDTNSHNVTITNNLQNAPDKTGGLTKQGTGGLTLTGASTYTGTTKVEGGSLWVGGSITSDVAIKDGGALGGTGNVGAITIQLGGYIAPGNSPGILHSASQTWEGGGGYQWEITAVSGSAGSQWDLLDIQGDLTLTATAENPFSIDLYTLSIGGAAAALSGFDATLPKSWQIANVTGTINGFDASAITVDTSSFVNDLQGGSFSVSQTSNGLVLNFSPVPEPGSVALLVAGFAGTLLRRRRL